MFTYFMRQKKKPLLSKRPRARNSDLARAAAAEMGGRHLDGYAVLEAGIHQMKATAKGRQAAPWASRSGYLFETHHQMTFNRDAILNHRADLRAVPTKYHAPQDTFIIQKGMTVASAQMKACKSVVRTAGKLQHPRYRKVDRLIVPTKNVNGVRRAAQDARRTDVAVRIGDHLAHEGIKSKPINRLMPKAMLRRADQLRRQAMVESMAKAAGVSAAVSAALTASANVREFVKGHMGAAEFGAQVVKSGARAGAETAVTTFAATRLASVMPKLARAAGGGLPVAIATLGLAVGKDAAALIKGDVGGAEFAAATGRNAAKAGASWGGAKVGAAIGMCAGPVGAAICGVLGGIVGLFVTSAIFD